MVLGLAIELLGISISTSRWLLVNGYYGGRYLIYGPEKDPVLLKLEQIEEKMASGDGEYGKQGKVVANLPANSCWLIDSNQDCQIQVDNVAVGLETISHWMNSLKSNDGYQLIQVDGDGQQKSWCW